MRFWGRRVLVLLLLERRVRCLLLGRLADRVVRWGRRGRRRERNEGVRWVDDDYGNQEKKTSCSMKKASVKTDQNLGILARRICCEGAYLVVHIRSWKEADKFSWRVCDSHEEIKSKNLEKHFIKF